METFDVWFRRQLKRRDWSRADFARIAEVPPRTVSAWANGEREPDPQSCVAIADAFGLGIDDVLRLAGHRVVDEPTEDDLIRNKLKALIDGIPATSLAPLVPMLQGLYDDAKKSRMRVIEGRRVAEEQARYGERA